MSVDYSFDCLLDYYFFIKFAYTLTKSPGSFNMSPWPKQLPAYLLSDQASQPFTLSFKVNRCHNRGWGGNLII